MIVLPDNYASTYKEIKRLGGVEFVENEKDGLIVLKTPLEQTLFIVQKWVAGWPTA